MGIKNKRWLVIKVLSLIVISILVLAMALSIINKEKMKKLIHLTSEEYIQNSLKSLKEGTVISIGVYKNGNREFRFFNKNGEIKEKGEINKAKEMDYELGSITKTMTGDIIYYLENNKKINVDESIDKYISLKEGKYPTIRSLLTHSNGYKTIYGKGIASVFNPMENYGEEDAIKVIEKLNDFKESSFQYSNFGYGTLGLVIEKVAGKPYDEVFRSYLAEKYDIKDEDLWKKEVGFNNNRTYNWGDYSFYIPAGAAVLNVDDLFKYLEKNIENYKNNSIKYEPLRKEKTNFEEIRNFGINFDGVSYGWLLDIEKNIVAHPGELPTATAFIGFNGEKNVGVIVLINQGISDEVSSKFIGAKILNELMK